MQTCKFFGLNLVKSYRNVLSYHYQCKGMSATPLVVILGSTGTGKTKLSIELAKKFGGEIINADSMQVYKGLDIITAKASLDERNSVPHHLIDFLDPIKSFSVVDFRNMALEIIDDLMKRNKIPIIVGGTSYYIEAILWQILISNLKDQLVFENFDQVIWKDLDFIDKSIENRDLHEILKELDPETAQKLHPNNRRRVLRAIQIIKQNGRKMSDLINDQQSADGGSSLGGPLRFSNSIVFWLQSDQKILDKRLDDRVDKMIEDGLVNELINFHLQFNEQRLRSDNTLPCDYTKGVFQTIGFKEFHDYLVQLKGDDVATNELFNKSVIKMKIATRRYARKQIKWMMNHFLGYSDRQVPPVYTLDATDMDNWEQNVFGKSSRIIETFLRTGSTQNGEFASINTEIATKRNQIKNDKCTYKCAVCDATFIGLYQFTIHKKSKKHKAVVEKKVDQRLLSRQTQSV